MSWWEKRHKKVRERQTHTSAHCLHNMQWPTFGLRPSSRPFFPTHSPSRSRLYFHLLRFGVPLSSHQNSCVTITPDPELAMYYCCLPLLCLSLLSIRGMSFNMPPITSRSQEAHLTSHSPCPLFLNEGHMHCGRLHSYTHPCMHSYTNRPVVMLGCVGSASMSLSHFALCVCMRVFVNHCVSGH